MKKFILASLGVISLLFTACNSENEPNGGDNGNGPLPTGETLYIVNSGNYGSSNASLSSWNIDTEVRNDLFVKANGFNLGEVAQSATAFGDDLWIVVNCSNVIFDVDRKTMKEVGRIDKGIMSPRYIHFVSEQKAYVTQMGTSEIAIVDPRLHTVMGKIEIPVGISALGGSSEEMVQIGKYVYVNLWSYDNRILKIDTETDKIESALQVGKQPTSLVADNSGYLWTLCDGGGWEENPIGYDAPSLVCINPDNMTIVRTINMTKGDNVSKLTTDYTHSHLYWINNKYNEVGDNVGGVYCMNASASNVPVSPVVGAKNRYLYSLTVSPLTNEIFVADAIDYSQNGVIYRYNEDGDLVGKFEAGIIPTSYTWVVE